MKNTKLQKIHIVTGDGKDESGAIRRRILEIMSEEGAVEVTDPRTTELIIVLGGDGTLMHASHTAVLYGIPIVGVNLGRIGYMAELEPDELDRLREMINGNYTVEERMMLTVSYNGRDYPALNDAVIRASTTHPAFVTLRCDGQMVNTYCGDGLICSTPTGSTAYSVSAGGSVIDPRLSCIGITPLCTQSLIARPLIFSPECTLTLCAEEGRDCILTIDGEDGIKLKAGETVTVKRSETPLKMIRVTDDGFYTVLNKKLYV